MKAIAVASSVIKNVYDKTDTHKVYTIEMIIYFENYLFVHL